MFSFFFINLILGSIFYFLITSFPFEQSIIHNVSILTSAIIFNNFILILIVSIILNLCLLVIIKSGIMGEFLKNKLFDLLKNKINLFYIVPFFISSLILLYLNNTVIYLEDKDIIVTTVIDNGKFIFSGDTFNLMFNNLGSAAVFSAGARIAAGLVSKYPMHLLPKTGIIGGVAAGFTLTFKIINNTFPSPISGNSKIKTGQVTVKLEGLTIHKSNSNITENLSLLEKYFGTHKIKSSNLNIREINNNLEISASPDQSSSVIEELDKSFPNWKEGFINSPLENGDLDNSIKPFLIETLTNNLILQFIIIYLIIIFIIIFTCKLILEKDIELKKIKNLPLGHFINNMLIKYISIWKTSANVWIYFLSFCIIIFSLGSSYSIYQIISFLK